MPSFPTEFKTTNTSVVAYKRCYRITIDEKYVMEQSPDKMGFAIDFKVKKSLVSGTKKTTNSLELQVWNLSASSLQNIQNNQSIVFECGYGGSMGVIFAGTITNIRGKNNGKDRITVIQAKEASLASQGDWDVRAFTIKKDSTIKAGVESLCNEIVATYPSITGVKTEGLPSSPFARDLHILGDPFEALYSLLEPYLLTYYVNNGIIYITPGLGKKNYLTTEISAQTGMVGAPQKITDNKKSKKPKSSTDSKVESTGWQITTLLNPRLEIGDRVDLTLDEATTDNNGNLVTRFPYLQMTTLVYKGNSFTGSWLSIITAEDVPLPSVSVAPATFNWNDVAGGFA